MKISNFLLTACCLATLSTPTISFAASTGTSVLGLIVASSIAIGGVDAIDFGTWQTGDGALSETDNVCVGTDSSEATPTYEVKATSTNGSFVMKDAALDTLAYSVSWDDATSGQTWNALTYDTYLTGQGNMETLTNCTNLPTPLATNASFKVDIASDALEAAAQGTYADTITFTVAST